MYFDLIPNNANENITPYLSARPDAEYWAIYINEKHVITRHFVDGELGRFISTLFESICVSPRENFDLENKKDNWQFIQSVDVAIMVFYRGAENFKTIHLDESFASDFGRSHRTSHLYPELTKIESVYLPPNEGVWFIKRFRKTVKTIIVGLRPSLDTIMCIPLYCHGIRELTLRNAEVPFWINQVNGNISEVLWRFLNLVR